MNITQLKYFHAVATYHTVSLAAQHLYISQPSLSNAIRELEREFSVTLFYRRYNGMFLTPEGTRLYNATKELLLSYDEVEHMMQDLGRDKAKLRLGIPPMTSAFIFADIYKNFVQKNSEIELTITEKGRYELLEKLNDGLLDILLLPHTKPFDSNYLAKKIGSLEIVCCVGRHHPLYGRRTVDAKALKGEPLVLFSDTFFQTKTIKCWFADASVEPTVSVQTEQLSTAQSIIESSLAVGFMFKSLARRNPSLAAIPLSPAVCVDVSVLRKKDTYPFAGIKKFEAYLEECRPFEE